MATSVRRFCLIALNDCNDLEHERQKINCRSLVDASFST